MMRISIINGSQKTGESNSGIILNALRKRIKNDCEIKNYKLSMRLFTEEIYNEIIAGDVIVLAFPLYGHSIPSNVLKMLIELERILNKKQTKEIIVYTIINNGLYEGKQTHIAFEMIKNWCNHCGIKFGGGIGQGAGEMLGAIKGIPLNISPFSNLGRALKVLANKLSLKEPFDIMYLSPYFPRFLWKIIAHSTWKKRASKNGLRKKDIISTPLKSDKNKLEINEQQEIDV